MDLNKVIFSRHSIRDYEDKGIKHEILSEILDIAKHAPSAGNMQNWLFKVIEDKKKMSKLSESCLNQHWISQAQLLIVVCYDERNAKILFPEKALEYSIQNSTIISTYIMLKATDLRLGSCWVDIAKRDEVSRQLKLPPNIIPSHIITLGYPNGDYKKTTRNEINLVTYFEGYGNKIKNLSIFPLQKKLDKVKKKLK